MTYQTTTNNYSYSRWYVDNVNFSPFTTVQAAMDNCNTAGGGTVVIRPGTYVENLTLYNNVNLEGATSAESSGIVTITGTHTPPLAGNFSIKRLRLLTPVGSTFNSAAIGTANIYLESVSLGVTNGYVFNLPNWTGNISCDDCSSGSSVIDGFINSSAADVEVYNSIVGAGFANTMTMSGNVNFNDVEVYCPVNLTGHADLLAQNCTFNDPITFSGASVANMYQCVFSTGGNTSIVQSSTGAIALSECNIISTNPTVIGGGGTGVVFLGNISYRTSSGIAGTVNVTYTRAINRISNYIVGASGNYLTIQAALDAANADGGGIVFVQPGTYTENLTLYGTTQVVGAVGFSDGGAPNAVTIIGVHTPPAAGSFTFCKVWLQSATHIFSSVVAGTAHLLVTDAMVAVTNGYLFNLPNWTGIFEMWNLNSGSGTNDGCVNNTGGATVFVFEGGLGIGNANPMIVSGNILIDSAEIGCPVSAVTGATFEFAQVNFTKTFTCSNNSTGSFTNCYFITGATSALMQSSTGTVSFANCTIDSTAVPVIDGAGAGAVTYGEITYLSNSASAGTITKDFTTRVETGVLKLSDATAGTLIATAGVVSAQSPLDVAHGGSGDATLTLHGILMGNATAAIQATAEPLNGQLLIGKTGDFPQLAGLTPGPGIAITNGAGTITVSAWGGGVSWTVETVNLNFTVNKGIIANKAGLLTVTLPATAAIGDILEITGINTAVGWRVAQNANQRIHLGAVSSTVGVGGYIEATAIRDSVKMVCVVAGASTEYNVISSIGNITVV